METNKENLKNDFGQLSQVFLFVFCLAGAILGLDQNSLNCLLSLTTETML